MKNTVFISSTFEDLKMHRKKLWDIISKYDVIVRGMEKFGARKEAPLTTCLSEVEQSDIYVGIIGFKLGSIENTSGKSFTQIEYEKALELNKNILIYLMDEKDAEITPTQIDFVNDYEKLKAFKSILKERHTIDYFINANDLAEKVDRKFNELLTLLKEQEKSKIDDYNESKKIISLFLILPKAYNGKEIKLKIKKEGKPFSASKAICNSFNLEYGNTLVQPIKVIKPNEIKEECFEHLFVDYRMAEKLFSFNVGDEIEVFTKLMFTPENVDTIKAYFYPRYRTYKEINPNYDPNKPHWELDNIISFHNPKYIEKTEKIEGEGKIIIYLKDIV